MMPSRIHLVALALSGTLLHSCGTSALTSLPSTQTIVLSPPIEPASQPSPLRLTLTSQEPLPRSFIVQGATFVALPILTPDGSTLYSPTFDSAFAPLTTIHSIELPNSAGPVAIAASDPSNGVPSDPTALIYQQDPTAVTFEDFVIIRALSSLPVSLRTAQNVALIANTLADSNDFSANQLEPLPTATNTDFIQGGTSPAPDILDAAVVFAAISLAPELRTAETLAQTVNVLLPGFNIQATDIQAIPGVSLPGSEGFINYDEAVDGDLSDDPSNPDAFVLQIGNNRFTATQQGSPRDLDFITVQVPEGSVLSQVVLEDYIVADPQNQAFLGLETGTTFITNPIFPTATNLLGGITFGLNELDTDILDDIGTLPGAIGFTGPLPDGDYTFWFNQTGPASTASLNLVVSAN